MSLMIKYISIILLFIGAIVPAKSKKNQYATVVFYNVENLFDTEISVDVIDDNYPDNDKRHQISVSQKTAFLYKKELKIVKELNQAYDYTPSGPKKWTEERYQTKIKNLTQVLSTIGVKETNTKPAIIGVAEVENERVVKDLSSALSQKTKINYQYSHFESPDDKGIDVVLLYDSARFKMLSEEPIFIPIEENGKAVYTRDILFVKGLLDGEEVYFFVNHWPSQRNGNISDKRRLITANVLKDKVQAVLSQEPQAKIFIMGDFNENPNEFTVKTLLKEDRLFNASQKLYEEKQGTLMYKHKNYVYDQHILSKSLIEGGGYNYVSTQIFNPSYLTIKKGKNAGYPRRSYLGNYYIEGFSDHYAIFSILKK